MIYIARAGSFKDGDKIEIPDGSIGITTEKTPYLGGLCVTWLEPQREQIDPHERLKVCGRCTVQCYVRCRYYIE